MNPENPINPLIEPLTASALQRQVFIPYTTSDPSLTTPLSGFRTIYFDGTNYWLYFFANNAWSKAPFNATDGFASGYGDGSDGDVTISTDTTLARDMFYSSLTVNTGKTLSPNGFKIYSTGNVSVVGTISVKGGDGGVGGDGQTADGSGVNGTGGTAGAAGSPVPSGTLGISTSGVIGAVGITGGAEGSANTKNGVAGTSKTNGAYTTSGVIGGNSGKGSIVGGIGFTDNSSTGGGYGTMALVTPIGSLLEANLMANMSGALDINAGCGSGAGGGCGMGNNSADAEGGGGGGGGSGAGGGILWIFAPTINISGTLTANGGDGGNGGKGGGAINAGVGGANYGAGGGGGGAGGNGGLVLLGCQSYTNTGTISYAGGTGGTGGIGQSGGVNGSSGSNGNSGHLKVFTLS